MSEEYLSIFEEIIEDIETSSTIKQIQLNVQKFNEKMISLKDNIQWPQFTENCINKLFHRLFSSDKVFKKFQDDLESDIEKIMIFDKLDKAILFNVFSEYLISQMRKQLKTLMIKRKYVYYLFETIFLKKSDNFKDAISLNLEGDMKTLFINKVFRIQTDFFNFLEESPQGLSNIEYFSKLIFIANQLEHQSCYQIINKIITMGEVEIIVQFAIKDTLNEKSKLNLFQETLKLKMINFNKYYLVIGHIIKMISVEIKNKNLQTEQGVKILKEYLSSLDENQLVSTLCDRILFTFTFNTETSKLLSTYFHKHLQYSCIQLFFNQQKVEKIQAYNLKSEKIIQARFDQN